MDDRTVPKIRTSTNFGTWNGFLVRDSLERYVVRILGPDFYQYGTWYGFWYGLKQGTDRGLGTFLYEIIRIGTNFFRYGSWYGAKFRKIKKKKNPFLNFRPFLRTATDFSYQIPDHIPYQ